MPAVMRAPLLAFLAVVPGVAAAAQGTAILYGSVTDSLGQPLRATVRVVGSPAMAVADGRGRYRLAVPAGRVIARAGHIGFRSQVDTTTIATGDSLERDYRLGAFPVEPQATIVTAAKHSQLLDESATSVARSEERRVGKECRSRWRQCQ